VKGHISYNIETVEQYPDYADQYITDELLFQQTYPI